MRKIFIKILASSLIFMLYALPVLAANEAGFKFSNPLGNNSDIFTILTKVVDFIMKVASIIVVLSIIYSGFLFVKAQGNDAKISEAKNTFFYSIIGAVLILGARLLASIVCNTISGLGVNLGGVCQ